MVYRLTIHCDKTEYLIITPKPFYGLTSKVTINGVNTKSVHQSKCSGMIIDNRLTWTRHMTSVRKSFSSKLYLLRRISFLPIATQEEIYLKPSYHQWSVECWFGDPAPTVAYSLSKTSMPKQHGLFTVFQKKCQLKKELFKLDGSHCVTYTNEGLAYSCLKYSITSLMKD